MSLLGNPARKNVTAIRSLLAALLLTLAVGVALHGAKEGSQDGQMQAAAPAASPHRARIMKINITIDDRILTGTLNSSKAARDFASLLPLSLTLEDYASTEKISDLPKRLSTDDAPPGFDPSAGDITYYAPWGNLALFHKDFHYSDGLVSLGTIDSGDDVLARPGSLQVRIELAPPK
jgi:hypothetical protein